MSSENRIILLLARGRLSALVQEQSLTLLATPLDWDLILERTIEQEVYPLFYGNLRTLGFPGVPAQARTQLHNLSKINALRNTLLTEELVRVLTRLGDAGIPTIPLKGVALAESLHGDTAARVCSDIDILVPRRSVREAFTSLLGAGFEAYDEKVELSDIDFLLNSNIEYSFVRRSEGMTFLIELHWDIAWRWRKNHVVIDDLWAEAQRKSYWAAEGYALRPEWELLYLAVHASRHQWQGIKWLVDIHEICASSRIDWEKLREKAKRLGLQQMLMLTLTASHALFETPIPAGFSLSILPQWLRLFPAPPGPTDVWKNNFFPARLFKRPSEKLGYLARVAFLPTLNELRLISLPSFLGFLYYPLRPLRLGCKWSGAFLRGGLGKLGLSTSN
ncbi:MAG: hypothetical protein DMG36_15630 [Acidobacteria bacterium]|nr:MAG: hypothetical protein DMG36_15630 [Acidobacteriota bacterium]